MCLAAAQAEQGGAACWHHAQHTCRHDAHQGEPNRSPHHAVLKPSLVALVPHDDTGWPAHWEQHSWGCITPAVQRPCRHPCAKLATNQRTKWAECWQAHRCCLEGSGGHISQVLRIPRGGFQLRPARAAVDQVARLVGALVGPLGGCLLQLHGNLGLLLGRLGGCRLVLPAVPQHAALQAEWC